MRALELGITARSDRYPPRGERIAAWVREYMARTGLSVGELAFKVQADKRDVRRLINENSCGPRLNDALEEAFGTDFIDDVSRPVVGDRIARLEREIANDRARIEARHAQIKRERAARMAHGSSVGGELRLVAPDDRGYGQ